MFRPNCFCLAFVAAGVVAAAAPLGAHDDTRTIGSIVRDVTKLQESLDRVLTNLLQFEQRREDNGSPPTDDPGRVGPTEDREGQEDRAQEYGHRIVPDDAAPSRRIHHARTEAEEDGARISKPISRVVADKSSMAISPGEYESRGAGPGYDDRQLAALDREKLSDAELLALLEKRAKHYHSSRVQRHRVKNRGGPQNEETDPAVHGRAPLGVETAPEDRMSVGSTVLHHVKGFIRKARSVVAPDSTSEAEDSSDGEKSESREGEQSEQEDEKPRVRRNLLAIGDSGEQDNDQTDDESALDMK